MANLLRLFEAPIEDISFHGPLDKTHGLNDLDRKMVTHQGNQERLIKAFEFADAQIYVYYVNLPGRRQYRELGTVSPQFVHEKISSEVADLIASRSPDAAHFIFTNNLGGNNIPLTPWMVAHRMAHPMRRQGGFGNNGWNSPYEEMIREIVQATSYILKYGYGYSGADWRDDNSLNSRGWSPGSSDDTRYKQELFKEFWINVATFQSARRALEKAKPSSTLKGSIHQEVYHELFAQYIMTKKNPFNPLPKRLTVQIGRDKRTLRLNTEDRIAVSEAESALENLSYSIENGMAKIWGMCYGKIYLM